MVTSLLEAYGAAERIFKIEDTLPETEEPVHPVTCGEIQETIQKASPLITEVKLFDIYRGANLGEGKKSMAFSLTLADPNGEVSNEQVERTVKKVLGNLKFKLGIEMR